MSKWHDYVVYKIYDFNTTNLKFEFRHFLFRMFQCYFLRGKKKYFPGKCSLKRLNNAKCFASVKRLKKNLSIMYESLIILVG